MCHLFLFCHSVENLLLTHAIVWQVNTEQQLCLYQSVLFVASHVKTYIHKCPVRNVLHKVSFPMSSTGLFLWV